MNKLSDSYANEVASFKKNWCNENILIIDILNKNYVSYFKETILDIGAGMGDIANGVFQDKSAICLDVQSNKKNIVKCSQKHMWVEVDFFEYIATVSIGTMLFSHSLQFLDEDIPKLQNKINEINSKFTIFVLNDNTELFGEVVSLTQRKYKNANPEINILEQLNIGTILHKHSFEATLACDTFDELCEQFSYLMLCHSKAFKNDVYNLLIKKIKEPKIPIKQTIYIYAK
jgi:hypothetical protein